MGAALFAGGAGLLAVPAAAPASAAPATYVIGNIGTYSGPVSGDYGSDRQVLNAWADYTNAHGGINGHHVKVISEDDQGNPSVGDQVAQELVNQDHVLAVIDDNSNVSATGPILQQAGVPLIGSTSVPPAADDDLFFPVGAGTLGETYGEVAGAKIVKAKKVAFLYCTNAAVCAEAIPLIKADAAANGASVSYTAATPEAAPNYTAYCLTAKQSGATVILTALASPAVIAIAQDCEQQGYKPTFILGGAPVGPTFASVSAMNNSIAVEGVFPWIEDSTPATKTFHQAIQKYAPGILTTQTYNATTAYSWADAEMFAAAAAKMKGDSPAALATALNTLKNEDLGGLIAPQSYTAGKQATPSCYSYMKQVNGKYQVLNSGKFSCPAPAAS